MAYTASQARKHFERLIREVEAGREVIITRNGQPVVKAIPWSEPPLTEEGQAENSSPES